MMIQSASRRFRAALIAVLILCALPSVATAAGRWRAIGPEAASAQALAAAAGPAGPLYLVTGRGNLYTSSDGAASWSRRGGAPFVQGLVTDPARSEVLYARSFNGLSKSVDGGLRWSTVLEAGVWDLRVAPSNPDVLYAASLDKGLLKSVDGGASWTATSLTRPVEAVEVDPGDPRIVYAAGFGDLSRSDDGGATWIEINDGLGGTEGGSANVSALAIDPRQPATLYALGGLANVHKSTDRGATWTLVWTGPGDFPWLRKLVVDPASGTVYAVDRYAGVFRSLDGGASWSSVLPLYGLADLAVDPRSPGRIYAASPAGGVYRSEDSGSSWTASNHGLRELGFVKVAADPHAPGTLFAVANPNPQVSLAFGPQYLLRSTDGGATWSSPFGEPANSPFVNDLAADPAHPGTWYLAGRGVLKTGDGGQTWSDASRGFRSFEFVYTLTQAPTDPEAHYSLGWDTFPLGNGPVLPVRVFRTTDGGERWFRSRLPGLDSRSSLLDTLAVDSKSASIIYAGGPGFFKSTDGGVHWRKMGVGLRNYVLSLAADPFSSGTLYASVHALHGRRVVKSTDGGATWMPAATGLPTGASWVGQIAPDPATPGTFYAATAKGVYVTRNGGALWTAINDGLGETPVLALSVDPLRPGALFAGTADGLFELSP
jgi:photosystem II stability/assembly factor-like uncharacterized protein